MLVRGGSGAGCPGEEEAGPGGAGGPGGPGGWLSLSATAASRGSGSRPLWLESLLTSERGSKGRASSSRGPGAHDDDVTPSAPPPASFPFSLPLIVPDVA